ncbi:MAG: thioredoxin family protein, partial [Eubacteriales bacterium]|nr:thioredoxin family protein [Eubacteriales bacterium]
NMKEITMMILNDCPHCKRARKMIEALQEKHPEYRDIVINAYDENEHPDISAKFDYYYVPSLFVDGKKLHEGVPSFESIENALKAALE